MLSDIKIIKKIITIHKIGTNNDDNFCKSDPIANTKSNKDIKKKDEKENKILVFFKIKPSSLCNKIKKFFILIFPMCLRILEKKIFQFFS